MIDPRARIVQLCGDTPIAVAPLMVLVNGSDLGLQRGVLVAPLLELGVIVKRAAREPGDLEQDRQ